MRFDPTRKLTRENLRDLPPLCTDGAWGTEMQKLGARPGELADVWNLEQPDKVLSVAKSYVEAGSQVILTNTFSSSRILLGIHGMADRAFALSKAGAELSKRAAQGKAYVFASIGPCGKMVMMGEADPDEVRAAAAEQARAFEEGGADAIVIETQSDLVEAQAALQGCLEACALPVGVSFTFDAGASNDRTMMGVRIPEVYDLAVKGGASFVGANCGAGIETFVGIAKAFQACEGGLASRSNAAGGSGGGGVPSGGPGGAAADRRSGGGGPGDGGSASKGGGFGGAAADPRPVGGGPASAGGSLSAALPIWIKGNAGRPQVDSAGNVRYTAGPEVFAAAVPPLLAAGAKFIGGCCGSTPEHVRAMSKALASRGDRLKIDA
jgi:methionine synthase I (cobalamin-dependent)